MWESAIERYLPYLAFETNCSKYKVANYKKLFSYLKRKLPLPFCFNDVRNLVIEWKQHKISAGYINYEITALNSFIRFCQVEKIPQDDIVKDINTLRPHEDRTPDANDLLSVKEIESILVPPKRNIPNKSLINYFKNVDTMYSLLFELCFKCGARSGEVCELKKKDFNFSNHSLTFYATKTGENRTVAIPPDMEDRLIVFMDKKNDTDFLFTAYQKIKGISQEMVNRMFKYRCKLAGIKRNVHIHQLRHSMITHMLIAGAPISTIQAIVGHKRLSTTQLYTHILVDNQRECMLKYNPLIRKAVDPILEIKAIKEFLENRKLSDFQDRIFYKIEIGNKNLRFEMCLK